MDSSFEQVYANAIANAKEILADVEIGDKYQIEGKEYTVIEKYPYIIRLENKSGDKIILNKADIATSKLNNIKESQKGSSRAVVCLTDGKRYRSARQLAIELGINYARLWRKIENIELINGKLYRWSED